MEAGLGKVLFYSLALDIINGLAFEVTGIGLLKNWRRKRGVMSINRTCGVLGRTKQVYFDALKNRKAKEKRDIVNPSCTKRRQSNFSYDSFKWFISHK